MWILLAKVTQEKPSGCTAIWDNRNVAFCSLYSWWRDRNFCSTVKPIQISNATEDALTPPTARRPRLVSRHTTLKRLPLERTNPGLSVFLSSFLLSGLEFLFCCVTVNGFTTMDGSAQEKVLQFPTQCLKVKN